MITPDIETCLRFSYFLNFSPRQPQKIPTAKHFADYLHRLDRRVPTDLSSAFLNSYHEWRRERAP